MATTAQVPTTSGHSLISCRQKGEQTARLGRKEGVNSSGPCSVLREGLLGTPLIPPWQPARVTAVTLSLPPFSCHMTQHHELHSLGNQTKTCVWKGECSAWHTHSTPCTDGQLHRVPVSLRSCLKSLSCPQPEWAKQAPLRSPSPVLWPMYVCRQVVSAVPMLYQLV